MKILLSFCVLFVIFLSNCSGGAVRQIKPLKFLVLQKSDIVYDINSLGKQEANEGNVQVEEDEDEQLRTTTSPEQDLDEEENRDEPEVTTPVYAPIQPWYPPNGWKELNFPVVPESNVSESNSNISPIPQILDISKSNVNISTSSTQNKFLVGRQTCQCGRPNPRIVNGEPARINDIPWTVALARNGFFGLGASKKPYCGGTLINDRYVATASHCVDVTFASAIKVWLNDEDLLSTSETPGGRLVYDVEKIIMHPKYDRSKVNFDIALLKLKTPVPISATQNQATYITPACIPINNDHDFSGLNATVAGWGVTSQGGSLPNVLMKVVVPIITNEQCNTDTEYTGKITENMLCAGYLETGGKDSCQGDSGGPLIIDNNQRNTLVGVVSWGHGCAKPKAPGVYTRVSQFVPWILENTQGAEYCAE